MDFERGRYYVYVHKGLDGTVFYVGKGIGDRAFSKDRQPEWHYYVEKILNKQYDVEIVKDGISEEDALRIEDALLAEHAATIINRQNMHAPVDSRKLIDYSDTIRAYSDTFRFAQRLDKEGKYKEAHEKYETAYNLYTKAMSLNDYDHGARRLLPKERIAPTQLADSYSKCLAKQGLHQQVVMFYERFFSDFGQGQTGVEVALKKRAEKSRMKVQL
jgi:tetratricopeptide (TPR) repeat protein